MKTEQDFYPTTNKLSMPGLYLHIPFCKQACHYCNFHFSTSLRMKGAMVEAIMKELDLQQGYLKGEEIQSIYFGGGTPSLLETKELEQIFSTIHRLHRVAPNAEITLEANPDDLTPAKLRDLKNYTPINRLSIGIPVLCGCGFALDEPRPQLGACPGLPGRCTRHGISRPDN